MEFNHTSIDTHLTSLWWRCTRTLASNTPTTYQESILRIMTIIRRLLAGKGVLEEFPNDKQEAC